MAVTKQSINLRIVRANAAKKIKERREMREHLSPFIKKVFNTVDPGAVYKHSWHIDLLSEYMEAWYYGQIRNLIINISPRHLKSITCTVATPAWILGKNPSEQIITGSYSSTLSKKHSVDCRLVIESDWYHNVFPGVALSTDQNEKTKFVTTKRGHRIATSVGGTATGEGGNYKILDDPINPKEAKSDTEREETNSWISQTWGSRSNDPMTARDLIVMQRLHVMDPTGYLMTEYPDKYEHVVVPLEAERKTIIIFPRSKRKLVRVEGDLMQPERIGPEQVKSLKKNPYVWAGQYQQQPTPAGGGRIDVNWFPRYKDLQEIDDGCDMTVLSFDTAQKEKEVNDPSVGTVYRRKDGRWYLRHLWKDRVRYPLLKKKVIEMTRFWKADAVLIEDKSSGESLIQELQGEDEFGRPYSIPVVAIQPEASKILRMDAQTPSLETGLLVLPDSSLGMPWLSFLEMCLMHFPNPPEWNELDSMSQFLKYVRNTDRIPDVAPMSFGRSSSWRGH